MHPESQKTGFLRVGPRVVWRLAWTSVWGVDRDESETSTDRVQGLDR